MDVKSDSIFITRWGATGSRVVMVHGSAQGSQVGGDGHFRAQQPLGARGWQVIVPDRPGHGRSPANGTPDDAEIDGAWVADLLGDGGHLVGHSFGGCVALAAAVKRPEAVRSLTLIEPGMQMLATDDPAVKRFGVQMLLIKLFSITAASRARRFAKLVGIPAEIGGGKSHAELSRMGRGISQLRIPSKETLQRELLEIKSAAIPLLVVTGGWNRAFEATGDRVAEAGGGQRLVIPSTHHFPQQVSGEFNLALENFMRGSDARRAVPPSTTAG